MNTRWLSITICCFFTCFISKTALATKSISTSQFAEVSNYISSHWHLLTRDMTKCKTLIDRKKHGKSLLYFPSDFLISKKYRYLQLKCLLRITYLPKSIKKMFQSGHAFNTPQGLLYLPHPYVVPGGMFNEMYGWDSYFIIRGLIEDNQLTLAKGMIENFFFEMDHYGNILNANRVYYLSRSQPPFLSSMVLSVYQAMKEKGQPDLTWLKKSYHYIIKDYEFWTHAPHLAGLTGLSRYFDFNNGPVCELKDTKDPYYRNAAKYFLLHPDEAHDYLALKGESKSLGSVFSLHICPENGPLTKKTCDLIKNVTLTKKFYQGDRAIRESGMDISFRFGPYGASTIDYAPLDLNSLLYKMEKDLEWMSTELEKKLESDFWHHRALMRSKKINQYFWNPSKGLFYDFDFRKNQQSTYDYITTFYPLWVGLATLKQAQAVRNHLQLFEHKGGLATSTYHSGAQWDYPYGWAPFQLIAIEGLRRYGFTEDADRLSLAFLSTISDNFHRDGTLREKYNVVTRSSETHIRIGYQTNEIGFGWTNGVFLTLLHELSS